MKTFRNIGLLLILATASMTANATTVTIQNTGLNCTGVICGIFAVNEVEITVQIRILTVFTMLQRLLPKLETQTLL